MAECHIWQKLHVIRRHDDQQFVFLWVGFADVVDDGHVLGLCGLKIVRALVANLKEQGGRLSAHESKDAVVHVLHIACYGPVETILESVQRPKTSIVALSRDDRIGSDDGSHLSGQVVSAADVSAQHRDDVQPHAVDAKHSRVFVLVLDERRNRSDADAHCSDEDKGVEPLPLAANLRALNHGGMKFPLERGCQLAAGFANRYNCYLLHLSISMG